MRVPSFLDKRAIRPPTFARPYGPWSLSPAAKGFCLYAAMSALPPKADMCSAQADVRFVPIADIMNYAKRKTASRRSLQNPVQAIELGPESSSLPLPSPPKHPQRAEAGREERKGGGKRRRGNRVRPNRQMLRNKIADGDNIIELVVHIEKAEEGIAGLNVIADRRVDLAEHESGALDKNKKLR